MFPDLPVKSKEWYTFFNKRVTFTEITEQVIIFQKRREVIDRQLPLKESHLLSKTFSHLLIFPFQLQNKVGS